MPFLACWQICLLDGHNEQQLTYPVYETPATIVSEDGNLWTHSLKEPVTSNHIRSPIWGQVVAVMCQAYFYILCFNRDKVRLIKVNVKNSGCCFNSSRQSYYIFDGSPE